MTLNDLNRHSQCTITTTSGDSIVGVYGGVETRHGDWSALVRRGAHTISIPIESIEAAIPAAA